MVKKSKPKPFVKKDSLKLTEADLLGLDLRRQALSLEQMHEIAIKKEQEALQKKMHWKSEESKKKSLANLTGPQTYQGAINSLSNLKSPIRKFDPNNSYSIKTLRIYDILSPDEQDYYRLREQEFRKDFDFNNSSDWILLNSIIMEEILLSRFLRYQIQNPGRDLSEQLNSCKKRLNDALAALGATRKERLKIKKDDTTKDIASLISSFEKEKIVGSLFDDEKFLKEEEQLEKSKLEKFHKEAHEVNINVEDVFEKDVT